MAISAPRLISRPAIARGESRLQRSGPFLTENASSSSIPSTQPDFNVQQTSETTPNITSPDGMPASAVQLGDAGVVHPSQVVKEQPHRVEAVYTLVRGHGDVVLQILSFSRLPVLANLHSVSKSWKSLIEEHEASIYRNAAYLHAFIQARNVSLEETVGRLQGDLWTQDPVRSWREFCAYLYYFRLRIQLTTRQGLRSYLLEKVSQSSFHWSVFIVSRIGKRRQIRGLRLASSMLLGMPFIESRSMKKKEYALSPIQ